jgi:murein DD-endopeptidase MepM/ murein hydrolase activator NlpD
VHPNTSPYVLPYPVSQTVTLYQGNCSLGGHHGVYRYSYDFLMPIGSSVRAARAGVVAEVLDGFPDGGPSENWVKIRHTDGTLAAYSHLHRVLVRIGQPVLTGQLIGLSGNSGHTGGVPHLHFHVSPCSEPVSCGTLPVTFRNASPNPGRLLEGRQYTALAWPGDLP